ncbi:hypothetical protein BD289DRAFT_108195 [Coniella lustricola]|uniref:Uncharacterized protein n=1 Tax=Coniella lustricola TaxID=2025994 RepID=A0A2T3AGM8_9PEZI|nr:hypothetical protein BD289DRAFT_108195 [Coniella lustricola]
MLSSHSKILSTRLKYYFLLCSWNGCGVHGQWWLQDIHISKWAICCANVPNTWIKQTQVVTSCVVVVVAGIVVSSKNQNTHRLPQLFLAMSSKRHMHHISVRFRKRTLQSTSLIRRQEAEPVWRRLTASHYVQHRYVGTTEYCSLIFQSNQDHKGKVVVERILADEGTRPILEGYTTQPAVVLWQNTASTPKRSRLSSDHPISTAHDKDEHELE